MAIERTTKVVNGQTVVMEIDPEADAFCARFTAESDAHKRLGFALNSRNVSTIGRGKHTGNMARANSAKEYKGTCSNKEWKRRRRSREESKLAREQVA